MKADLLRDVVLMTAGKNASVIVDLLFDKKNVNEFLIAKKLNLTINQARNILYKLSDEGLVTFTRKKDKKKGWYTYFWTFNDDKALLILQKHIIKEIESFEHQLKSREIKRFYVCRTCNAEITEENAMLHNFICPECGEVYDLNDNKKAINEINSQINKLKKQLAEVVAELDVIEKDRVKKQEKDRKKLEKEKTEKRKNAQAERAKIAKKAGKIKKPNSEKISKKKSGKIIKVKAKKSKLKKSKKKRQ